MTTVDVDAQFSCDAKAAPHVVFYARSVSPGGGGMPEPGTEIALHNGTYVVVTNTCAVYIGTYRRDDGVLGSVRYAQLTTSTAVTELLTNYQLAEFPQRAGDRIPRGCQSGASTEYFFAGTRLHDDGCRDSGWRQALGSAFQQHLAGQGEWTSPWAGAMRYVAFEESELSEPARELWDGAVEWSLSSALQAVPRGSQPPGEFYPPSQQVVEPDAAILRGYRSHRDPNNSLVVRLRGKDERLYSLYLWDENPLADARGLLWE